MQLLRELSWYFKQQRWRYISAMLMLMAVAILNLLPPWITGTLVDEAIAGTLDSSRLLFLVGSIALIGLCIYVLRYFWRLSLYSASYRLGTILRQQLHDRLLYQQPGYFRKHHTGDLMARATNDVLAVEMSAGEAVLALFDGLLTCIIVVAPKKTTDFSISSVCFTNPAFCLMTSLTFFIFISSVCFLFLFHSSF